MYEAFDIDNLDHSSLFDSDLWEYVLTAPTKLKQNKRLKLVTDKALDLGFTKTEVNRIYSDYKKDRALTVKTDSDGAITEFENQPLPLVVPEGWRYDPEIGIFAFGNHGERKVACTHPVLPVARLKNIITGREKIELWYSENKGRHTVSLPVAREVMSNKNKIIELANYGLRVNSGNAGDLVQFLADIEAENEGIIPIYNSTSSLGWTEYGDSLMFLPYDDEIYFDSTQDYREIFEAIETPAGSFEAWRDIVAPWRDKSHYVRIALAASFASIILGDINSLSFFVHFWSPLSSTGKTVLLMLASSIWGNPETYMQSFNMTEVGAERLAGFLKNLPMVMDELQHVRDNWGNIRFNVYKLSQGRGRARGTKTGGFDYIPTWNLAMITSGETPLSETSESSGAKARVLEVLIEDQIFSLSEGNELVGATKANYGHAGREFVNFLKNFPKDVIKEIYDEKQNELVARGIQAKQAMLGATLLTADQLASFGIWEEQGTMLCCNDICTYLLETGDEDIAQKAYETLMQFYVQNSTNFQGDKYTEIYGEPSADGSLYIISNKAQEVLEKHGFNYSAALTAMRAAGLIRGKDSGGRTYNTGMARLFNSSPVRCVELEMQV